MSTRTDWGLFMPDGSRLEPVAVGDAHWRWECPQKEWVYGDTQEHPITGEDIPIPPYSKPCPFREAGPKREQCQRCNMVFLYP